jgi:hypothetical protein
MSSVAAKRGDNLKAYSSESGQDRDTVSFRFVTAPVRLWLNHPRIAQTVMKAILAGEQCGLAGESACPERDQIWPGGTFGSRSLIFSGKTRFNSR